jgi:hypothetical protein
MNRARNPLTAGMRVHLDHQMADALALAREIKRPRATYSQPVRRAIRLAYATHYRVLLEFFHDGRSALLPRAKAPHRRDIIASDVMPPGRPVVIKPTAMDGKRLRMADKLAAHMSRERTQYQASKQEWGNARDRRAILRRVQALFEAQPRASSWFPCTADELHRA